MTIHVLNRYLIGRFITKLRVLRRCYMYDWLPYPCLHGYPSGLIKDDPGQAEDRMITDLEKINIVPLKCKE